MKILLFVILMINAALAKKNIPIQQCSRSTDCQALQDLSGNNYVCAHIEMNKGDNFIKGYGCVQQEECGKEISFGKGITATSSCGGSAWIWILLILLLAAGGALYYFKVYKKNKTIVSDTFAVV